MFSKKFLLTPPPSGDSNRLYLVKDSAIVTDFYYSTIGGGDYLVYYSSTATITYRNTYTSPKITPTNGVFIYYLVDVYKLYNSLDIFSTGHAYVNNVWNVYVETTGNCRSVLFIPIISDNVDSSIGPTDYRKFTSEASSTANIVPSTTSIYTGIYKITNYTSDRLKYVGFVFSAGSSYGAYTNYNDTGTSLIIKNLYIEPYN